MKFTGSCLGMIKEMHRIYFFLRVSIFEVHIKFLDLSVSGTGMSIHILTNQEKHSYDINNCHNI